MLKDQIAGHIRAAVAQAQADGALPAMAEVDIQVERPQNPDHGDYASNVALRLARAARMNPLQIATLLAELLRSREEYAAVEAAAPGFVNLTLAPAWLASQVPAILEAGDTWGNVNLGNGLRVQVEFVSANPTGPIHIGGGRGAVLGSALSSVLAAAGYDVTREYYINDAGSQMLAFYDTLCARYLQALGTPVAMPAEGYAGAYMVELAEQMIAEAGDRYQAVAQAYLDAPAGSKSFDGPEGLGPDALARMLDAIKVTLARLGVEFDVWFSERSLATSGDYDAAMDLLRDRGYLEEREGARWFVSTALGESKDNVVVRSNGIPTYFASDIAYHHNKFGKRGFDWVIDIWGADHGGHVSRMKAVLRALGHEEQRFDILLTQMVLLKRGGEVVKISKRTGDLITVDEVIDEVGTDACRFNFLSRSADSQMEFDLEIARQEGNENPVYYVQYAHARMASILRNAAEQGRTGDPAHAGLLQDPAELALIQQMLELPEVVARAASSMAPHHLPHYAMELATAFHGFYRQCRVISEDEALTSARLVLVEAAGLVLRRTLTLMGMTAPETM